MASYKSHFSPSTRPENQPSLSQRSSSTRLPTRSTTPVSSQSQIPVPHPAQKSAKKKIIQSNEHALGSGGPHTQRSAATQFNKAEEAQRAASPDAASSHSHTASGALPSSLPQPSSSRFARHDVSMVTRTPSLVSGSSVSTMDSPRSNLLRRKPSPIEKHTARSRAGSNCSQEDPRLPDPVPVVYNDAFEESILGITLPPAAAAHVGKGKAPAREGTHYLDFETPHDLATQDLPPPTPLYALSASPSTKYSGSPGPFSHASTPTSMSSHSPEIVFAAKPGTRPKQLNPSSIRSPVIRRKTDENSSTLEPQPLSSVRESSNSSSSGSTVKADESGRQKDRTKKARLPAPPPSPSLRKTLVQSNTRRIANDIPPKTSSPEHTRSRPIQTPPELAHLMQIPSASSTASQKPARPSREGVEGTNEILRLRQTSPIIQSNLVSLPSAHHRRQTSSDSTRGGISGLFHSTKSKLALPTKSPSRNPSPNPSLSSTFSPVSSLPPTRKPTPDVSNDGDQRLKKGPSPTAASPSKSTSRFDFFTRRPRTEPTPSAAPAGKKLRKGPMAGTGHEGYGRYALRGRSGSTISGSGSVGRSASAGSTTSSTGLSTSSRKSSTASPAEPDMDNSLRERLAPVAIRGETVTHPGSSGVTEAYRGLDSTQQERIVDPKAGPKLQDEPSLLHAHEHRRPVLLPSPMSEPVRSFSPTKRHLIGQRTPSEEGASAVVASLPTLAARRSFLRSQYTDDPLSIKVPTPIDTMVAPVSPSIGSSVTGQYSVAGTDSNTSRLGDISDGKEGNWFTSKRKGTRSKAQTKPSRRWNFFQRAQAPSPTRDHYVEEVPVSVVKQPLARSVPHYAMMEMNDIVDMEDLEKIMQEADNTTDDQSGPEQYCVSHGHRPAAKPSHGHSVLLPSPPSFPTSFVQHQRPVSPEAMHECETPTHHSRHDSTDCYQVPSQYNLHSSTDPSPIVAPVSDPSQSRPSRLAQIGRIPQVVSKRDRDRKLSDQSFSRPFAPSQPRPTVQSPSPADGNRESLASPEWPQPLHAGASGSTAPLAPYSFDTGYGPASADTEMGQPKANDAFEDAEFFSFPPRKDSELSYSSSSGIMSFPVSTAIVPAASAPQSEDEVWNEYDDLIDDVLSPKTPISAGSSQGAPFHYTNLAIGHSQPNQRSSRLSSIGNAIQRPHTASNPADLSAAGARALSRHDLTFPPTLSAQGTPHTPMSFTDFFAGYGERNLSTVDGINNRMSTPSTSRISPASGRLSLPASVRPSSDTRQSNPTQSLPKTEVQRRASNRNRDAQLIELAEKNSNGFESMANLRFGALMTSKWLSFGRVLFSPAHFELKNQAEDRVLVLDGLGKDWSYYCALTYPNASIYNLGPTASDTSAPGARDSSSFQTLPNHRHIHHLSIASPFPFPRGFFAAVVFRFPIATSEAALRCAVFECKRVLRPGGHLELSVLDIDMLNMGNRARRAVRALKLQMQAADPSVSLKPMSDTMQRLLGRRGFENLNRCIVGVPAAGRIPGSRDEGQTSEEKDLSFSDLLKDQTKDGDEGITKMVAKVGRWWYSRCYETLVLPHGDLSKSIWADETLRKECEKRQTSFRLLICYAQKPMVAMRRTVSV